MNLIEADHLNFSYGEAPLLEDLSFVIRPGLTFVRGGEGRGKSTLLRLLSGALNPTSGVLRRLARTTYLENPSNPLHDSTTASAWLESSRLRFPDWNATAMPTLLADFGLSEHIDKPMYMLSTGSRRKVGLAGAAASQAQLTLLETPFAALDSASRRLLTQILAESASSNQQTWVLADYELPPSLAGIRLSGFIDLGD